MFHVIVRYTNGEAEYICMHCEEIGNVLKLQHIKYKPYKEIVYIPLGSSAIIDVKVMPMSKEELGWWEKSVIAPNVGGKR